MVAIMHMLENLSVEEKEAIMGVLSRDRRLRETEEERVMRLRVELARERRAGFVISVKGKPQRKRTCARCRDAVGLTRVARCPICKHIICKNCRVVRQRPSDKGYKSQSDIVESRSPINRMKSVSSQTILPYNAVSPTSDSRDYDTPLVVTSTPVSLKQRYVKGRNIVNDTYRQPSHNGEVECHTKRKSNTVGGAIPIVICNEPFEGISDSDGAEINTEELNGYTAVKPAKRTNAGVEYDKHVIQGSLSDSASGLQQTAHRKSFSDRDVSSDYDENDAVTFLRRIGSIKTSNRKDIEGLIVDEIDGDTTNPHKIEKTNTSTSFETPVASSHTDELGDTSEDAEQHQNIASPSPNPQYSGSKQQNLVMKNTTGSEPPKGPDLKPKNDFISSISKVLDLTVFSMSFWKKQSPPNPQTTTINSDTNRDGESSELQQAVSSAEASSLVVPKEASKIAVEMADSNGSAVISSTSTMNSKDHCPEVAETSSGIQDTAQSLPVQVIKVRQLPPVPQQTHVDIQSVANATPNTKFTSSTTPTIASDSLEQDGRTSSGLSFEENTLTEDQVNPNPAGLCDRNNGSSCTNHYRSCDTVARKKKRKSIKQRMTQGSSRRRKHLTSSSDCDDIDSRHPRHNNTAHYTKTTEHNRGFSDCTNDVTRTRSATFTGPVTPTHASMTNVKAHEVDVLQRRSSLNPSLLTKLKARMSIKSEDESWICKVCARSLDLNMKSGDWFYKNARSEVLQFKETLSQRKLDIPRKYSSPLLRNIDQAQNVTVTSDAELKPSSDQLRVPAGRERSHTIDNFMLPQRCSEDSVVSLEQEASLNRRRLRLKRKTVAEVLHGSLLIHIPDPEGSANAPQFLKKKPSVPQMIVAASIRDKPQDLTVLRGKSIDLSCSLQGTPPIKSVWRKGKNEIKSNDRCLIDCNDSGARLNITSSDRDDSGCYTLQVRNSGGVDQYSVNVSVVDVPDPPGKPHASDINGSSLVVSWYGTGYDGGSTVTGYIVEMADVGDSSTAPQWQTVASAKSTSCTVTAVERNCKYLFRVCARNEHGMSAPGEVSDVVLNTVTEVEDSSDDEEGFVEHGTVVMKTDGTFSEKYETREKLGQGRFGKVHRVVDRETGREYAAKIMRALKAKDKDAVKQEIDIMNNLRHPRLVQLVDAYSQGREITMVMDLVSGGELFERVIDEDFELTEAACIKYMSQICEGLKFMHEAYILHLDLKPENIMCINKTGTQIKIIDFGLARKFNPNETIRVMFGTPEFVAPEVINYDAIGTQTDMWSVGVICYILLSGLSPFMGDNDSETLSNITAAEWDFEDEAFDEISHEAKDFIRQLLVKNLKKRHTVHKALEHKWLKKDTKNMSKSKLNTKNLKRFLARRKWQKTGNAVRALGRLASLANIGSGSKSNKSSNGQSKESGFLAALKSQLLRENEDAQDEMTNCKPVYETLFDDVEVIEGSAAKFECIIVGTPDPEIMWYKDGQPIKESRHMRISYTEDDVCTLLITEATEADEAEYTCKAVNCEGETEHRAELIVITPGM